MKNRKKIIIILLALVIIVFIVLNIFKVVSINGKSHSDKKVYYDNEEELEMGDNWRDFVFLVNSKILELPLSYSSFSATSGFKIKAKLRNGVIGPNDYRKIKLYRGNKEVLSVMLKNYTDDALKYTDATIVGIIQSTDNIDRPSDAISFPGGITVGMYMNKDKLFNAFGEADEVEEKIENDVLKNNYKYYFDSSSMKNKYYTILVAGTVIEKTTFCND